MYNGKFLIFKRAQLEDFMNKRVERLVAVSKEYKDQLEEFIMKCVDWLLIHDPWSRKGCSGESSSYTRGTSGRRL